MSPTVLYTKIIKSRSLPQGYLNSEKKGTMN